MWGKKIRFGRASVFFALLLLSSCGYFESKESIESWVKQSIQKDFQNDVTYQGITVASVALVRESASKFTGYVEFNYGTDSEKSNLTVMVDSDQKMYQVEPPRGLILKKSFQSITNQLEQAVTKSTTPPQSYQPGQLATLPLEQSSQEAEMLNKYSVSFDCNMASSNAEKIICSTPILNKLDGLLAVTYKERISDPDFGVDQKLFKTDQLAWVTSRNTCGDVACLEKAYRSRIGELCEMPVVTGVHPTSDCDAIEN